MTPKEKEQDYTLELFPARTREELTVTENKEKKANVLEKQTAGKPVVHIPLVESAYSRTVRFNLALHSLYQDLPEQSQAALAVEDAMIHTHHAKAEGQVRRDELSAALRDIQRIIKPNKLNQVPVGEECLHIALRSKAIVESSSVVSERTKQRFNKIYNKSTAMLGLALSKDPAPTLTKVLDFVKQNDKASALNLMKELILKTCAVKGKGDKPGDTPGTGPPSHCWMREKKKSGEKGDKHSWFKEEGGDGFSRWDFGWSEYLVPRKYYNMFRQNSGPPPRMTIQRLNHVRPKETRLGRSVKMLTTGLHIRSGRLASAAISPTPLRIFERVSHKRGGCVLIDTSGSMGISDATLWQLVEALPLGTIAYYSGTDSAANPVGNLVIYAENGLAYEGGESLPFRQGGNSIDFPAVQWLLQQPGPRWYIGDWGFCGVRDDYSNACRSLLAKSRQMGLVKVFRSVKATLQHIQGEYDIPDQLEVEVEKVLGPSIAEWERDE